MTLGELQRQVRELNDMLRSLREAPMADEKKLKLFRVHGTMTIGVWTVVAAASREAALEKADERGVQGLCWDCSNSSGATEEWRMIGELDGLVDLGEVDELDLDDIDTEYADYLHDEEAELNDAEEE